MSDVEGTQFLVSQSQKPKNVHIVLVSPNEPTKQPPQHRAPYSTVADFRGAVVGLRLKFLAPAATDHGLGACAQWEPEL